MSFNDTLQLHGMIVNDELKISGRGLFKAGLHLLIQHFYEEIEKIAEDLSRGRRFPDRYSNSGPHVEFHFDVQWRIRLH